MDVKGKKEGKWERSLVPHGECSTSVSDLTSSGGMLRELHQRSVNPSLDIGPGASVVEWKGA